MKTFSLILACSILSAAAGYFFGVKQAVPASTKEARTEAVEPTPTVPNTEPLEEAELVETIAKESTVIIDIASPHEARANQAMQTLTDTKGRRIEAKVLKVVDDQVTIRRQDGLETTIPLSMLSPEDIEFCEYVREQSASSTSGVDWEAIFGE